MQLVLWNPETDKTETTNYSSLGLLMILHGIGELNKENPIFQECINQGVIYLSYETDECVSLYHRTLKELKEEYEGKNDF